MQNSLFIQDVVELTNQYRKANGLTALAIDLDLVEAAQQHSQTMATLDFFSHTGLDGSLPWDRAISAGYESRIVGENIAAGYTTPAAVVDGWINSPDHRANILDPNYNEIGVGYYFLANDPGTVNANYYWTQVFGRGELSDDLIVDPLQYGASHPDLIRVFGYNSDAFRQHYETFGKFEGRAADTFNEVSYLANNPDLIQAFGYDLEAATRHYIQFGYDEGRPVGTFNPAYYLASHSDLIQAFGYDLEAAAQHYVSYGRSEQRSANGFNPETYLNKYADLQAVFGGDLEAATRHYIEFGQAEGRSWSF